MKARKAVYMKDEWNIYGVSVYVCRYTPKFRCRKHSGCMGYSPSLYNVSWPHYDYVYGIQQLELNYSAHLD